MAYVTKTINGTTGVSNLWTFKVVVTETAIDTVNKTSTVKLEAFLGRKSGAGNSWFGGTYTLALSINGSAYSYEARLNKTVNPAEDGQYYSLGSKTFTVTQTTTPLTVEIRGNMTAGFSPKTASIQMTYVTLTKLHEAPLLGGNIEWTETNSILNGTGIDSSCFVTHLSKKTAKIPVITYDDATVTEYRIINESKTYKSATDTVTIDLTKNPLYVFYEEQSQKTIPKLYVGFTDSTGAKSQWAYPHTTYIPYEKPSLKATASSVKRNGQISGKARLNLTASVYPKVGNKTNTVTLKFKYWATGASKPSTSYTIPSSAYTLSNGKLTITNWDIAKSGTVISDLDKSSSYKFEITLTDAFGYSSTIELICPKGEWLRAIFKDRIDFARITKGGVDVATVDDVRGHRAFAYLETNATVNFTPWNTVLAPLNKCDITGTKLSFNATDHKIYIGAGVEKVMIWGSVMFNASVAGTQIRAWTNVHDTNGTGRFGVPAYGYKPSTGSDSASQTLPVPPFVISVVEGESISLTAMIGISCNGAILEARATSLYVEVIE